MKAIKRTNENQRVKSEYPDVELSRKEAFGHSEGVDERAGDVEDAHQNDPAERVVLDRLPQTVNDDDVRHRQKAAHQTERYEQPCSHSERSFDSFYNREHGTI